MNLCTLPFEIIGEQILKFLPNNIDLLHFRYVCKLFYTITTNYGFIKKIKFTSNDKFFDLINILSLIDNFNLLQELHIQDLIDPHIFLPNIPWPPIVLFYDCIFNSIIDPPQICNRTQILQININRNINYKLKPIEINWNKFPNLSEIYIKYNDLIFSESMLNCFNLKVICINLKNKDKILPKWFGYFNYLEMLITNIYSNKSIHFISPNLNICLSPKIQPFSAISKFIAKKHLLYNIYVDIY